MGDEEGKSHRDHRETGPDGRGTNGATDGLHMVEGMPPQPAPKTWPIWLAGFLLGVFFIGVWIGICSWAEEVSDAAHPGGGASFFTLVPILFGWVVFLVGFPILYAVTRALAGLWAPMAEANGIVAWSIWGWPIVAYVVAVAFSAFSTLEFSETVLAAALFFPLLCWRVYASMMDMSRDP